jgi:hypothetical protein
LPRQNLFNYGKNGEQSEMADLSSIRQADILFKSRADLEHIHKDLVTAAITGFGVTESPLATDFDPVLSLGGGSPCQPH